MKNKVIIVIVAFMVKQLTITANYTTNSLRYMTNMSKAADS